MTSAVPMPTPQEAEAALREVRRQQSSVLLGHSPAPVQWHVLGVGLLVAALTIALETGSLTIKVLTLIGYAVGLAMLTRTTVARNRVRWHRSLWDRTSVLVYLVVLIGGAGLLGGVVNTVLSSAGVAFSLTATVVVCTVYAALAIRPLENWMSRRLAKQIEAGTR